MDDNIRVMPLPALKMEEPRDRNTQPLGARKGKE
jgi:hypothetical protein